MAIDDVYQVQLNQRYAGQQCMNSVHFRMKTATDPSTAQLQVLAEDWKELIRGLQVSAVTHTGWIAQQMRGGTVSYASHPCRREGGRRIEGGYTGTVVGAIAGEGLPPQSALVTTIGTGFSGRRRRGRVYLLGLAEATQNAGTVDPGTVTLVQTAWTTQFGQFGTGGSDANFEMGIWSMTTATGCTPLKNPPYGMTPSAVPDPAAAFLSWTTYTVRNIVYTQRRRTIGVGR